MSSITTGTPDAAHACAMPLPIVPAPMTPALRIVVMLSFEDAMAWEARAAWGRRRRGRAAFLRRDARRLRDESAEEHVDEAGRGRGKIIRRGIEHPLVHDAHHVGVQRLRGERRVEIGRQLARARRVPHHVLDLREAGAPLLLVRGREPGELVDELALVEHDLEDVLGARVVGELRERADRQRRAACRADPLHALCTAWSKCASSGSVARSHIARKRSALSLKCQYTAPRVMPAAVATSASDVRVTPCSRNRRLRRVEQALARGQRLFLGLPCHVEPESAAGSLQTFVNVCNLDASGKLHRSKPGHQALGLQRKPPGASPCRPRRAFARSPSFRSRSSWPPAASRNSRAEDPTACRRPR